MQPQASAATAADHLLLSEHTETSAATADTPPAWDLWRQHQRFHFPLLHHNSGSLITTHTGVLQLRNKECPRMTLYAGR